MEDIEDLFTSNNNLRNDTTRNEIYPRVRKRQILSKNDEEEDESNILKEEQSCIPGTQKIYVKTWGCTHNNSDSEYMAGQLSTYGYKIVDEKEKADLWLLNSCTVKNPAEDHFRNEVISAKSQNKKIVVSGCVPQGAPRSSYLQGLSVVGVQQIDRVVEVVEETLKGNTVRLLGPKRLSGKRLGGAPLALPKIRRNPLVEIISISTGCLNQCSYCKTKHARGQLGSYPIEEIVNRAVESFKEGVIEVWLTSEDTGAYGIDIGVTLPDLLWALVEVIPRNCRLRLGMTNPPYILDHLQEMSKILSHPRVYSFLHVPVQSGSNQVLSHMKREYFIQDFKKVVDTLKESVEGITIATDIICGYPTETEQDFEETMQLCHKYKFPSLFINQFYPRPGTPAAKLKRIPTQQVKHRSRRLTDLFHSYEPYKGREGEMYEILVTETAHDGLHWVGHNKYYEQILLTKEHEVLGEMVKVRIIETGKYYMKAELIANENTFYFGNILAKLQRLFASNESNSICKKSAKESTEVIISTSENTKGKNGCQCELRNGEVIVVNGMIGEVGGKMCKVCDETDVHVRQGESILGMSRQEMLVVCSFVIIVSVLLVRLYYVCCQIIL